MEPLVLLNRARRLRALPRTEAYESALTRPSFWQMFRYITLPLITPSCHRR